MSNDGFNKFCKKIGFMRNSICDTNEYGGKYEIINLYDYIMYQQKEYNTKFKFQKKDDTIYVLFYRFDNDEDYGKNILNDFFDYKTLVKKYMNKEYNLGWNESSDKINVNIERWGHSPGIGINVSFFPNYYYVNSTITEFWIPIKRGDIKENIRVCCIPNECTWTQISCDKKNILKYDIIAHFDTSKPGNDEINITDNGRKRVEKIIQCKDNKEICDFLLLEEKDGFNKSVEGKEKEIVYVNGEYIIVEKKVPNSISEFTKIITSTSLDDLKDIEKKVFINEKFIKKENMKGGTRYYNKYLKYKSKYFKLKNL